MQSIWIAALLNCFAPVLYLVTYFLNIAPYEDCTLLTGAGCDEVTNLRYASYAAVLAVIVGIVLPFVLYGVPSFLGKNRLTLRLLFPLLLPVVITATLLISISSIVFVVLSGHIITTWVFEIIWPYMYLVAGLGGLFLVSVILYATKYALSIPPHREFGALLDESQMPELREMVASLATKLKVRPPKNIIIGASPNFYITNTRTVLFPAKNQIKGTTLYLSASLSRLLTKSELEAVIAHELMHHKGKDLAYTKTFYPIHRLLNGMIAQLDDGASEEAAVAGFPLLVNLQPLRDGFTNAERAISRKRELAADKGAAAVTSAKDLCSALAKVIIFSEVWNLALDDHARALELGDGVADAAASLYGYAVYECSHDFVLEQFEKLGSKRLAHPTDTHPTMSERLDNLGVSLSEIELPYYSDHDDAAGAFKIEEKPVQNEISSAFLFETVANKSVRFPEEGDADIESHRLAYRLIYQLLTHFIRADGKTLPEEVQAAEKIGVESWPLFNPLLFRDYVHSSSELDSFESLADLSGRFFNENGEKNLIALMDAVISADGERDASELKLLSQLREAFSRARSQTSPQSSSS